MTTEDTFRDWAPLAALDALDGPDRAAFESHLQGCGDCSRELRGDRAAARRLPWSLAPVMPSPALKRRVLEAVAADAPQHGARAPERLAGRTFRWTTLLAALTTAAALVLGLTLFATREERDQARRTAEANRGTTEATRAELAQVREQLEREAGFRELVAHPDSRVTPLASLAAGSGARARMVWNPASRAAVLLVSGLAKAPEGSTYEVWVIADGAPVPAGLFQVDSEGRVHFALPTLEATTQVRTFAVTIEPVGGRPAPSGPMVLAGRVS